ncbi:unnamed protein product [Schistocephalus solidus]|uniref:Large ribosomal subunit protein uL11m n=1 Tax=Schistocephalus solidus TaxID=70667 RepID=A0A183SUF1_SCHSO|nr:unnamed protein product [Schistocephalus solidus]
MAARAATKMSKKAKAAVDMSKHPPFMHMFIPAQQAKPAPPLGPQLGKPDRSYNLQMSHPPSFYLLRLAAGCKKGAATPGTEVAGRLTLKHIYEIACLKKQDAALETVPLKSICISLISTAHRLGIQIISREELENGSVDHSPEAYAEFLKQRDIDVAARKKALEEKKQAKLMRVS